MASGSLMTWFSRSPSRCARTDSNYPSHKRTRPHVHGASKCIKFMYTRHPPSIHKHLPPRLSACMWTRHQARNDYGDRDLLKHSHTFGIPVGACASPRIRHRSAVHPCADKCDKGFVGISTPPAATPHMLRCLCARLSLHESKLQI